MVKKSILSDPSEYSETEYRIYRIFLCNSQMSVHFKLRFLNGNSLSEKRGVLIRERGSFE